MPDSPSPSFADIAKALSLGKKGSADDSEAKKEMRLNRRVAMKKNASLGQGNTSVSFATARPKDPMWYWKQNNLPWDLTRDEDLKRIREWCRHIYASHPVIGPAIDIYSRFPLVGMEFQSKDSAITDFYTELFFEQLDYEEFLIDVGRSYWSLGESFPLGSFNETLGVWEDDELIDPNHVEVVVSPFMKEPRFMMGLPESIKKILIDREPRWEYDQLVRNYPEFTHFLHEDKPRIPVSNVLMKHLKFKGDLFHVRGISILMRGFRTIIQEEMLNAAQDAVADRLYTPLLLAKLGATAQDLGTQQPWIPTDDDIAEFEEALDAALAADFRVLTHHFGVDLSSVFGREVVPDFTNDFDRMTERLLQVFGLSKTMLSGSAQGQTYAADALNRDLVSQLLQTYQKRLKKLYKERALVVAEAQEHYDFEERGGKRYVIMEEILEVDEESGEERIVEQPKLLIPELKMRAMNMNDENALHQLLEALKQSGVPISMKSRLINVPIDLEEEIEINQEEQIELAVKTQETRRKIFLRLRKEGLPIPPDLEKDFQPVASNQQAAEQQDMVVPTLIPGDVALSQNIPMVPVDNTQNGQVVDRQDLNQAQRGQGGGGGGGRGGFGQGAGGINALPRNKARPPESDEQRAGMPKPAKITLAVRNKEGKDEDVEIEPKPGGMLVGPSHVGSRRHKEIKKDEPLP